MGFYIERQISNIKSRWGVLFGIFIVRGVAFNDDECAIGLELWQPESLFGWSQHKFNLPLLIILIYKLYNFDY